MKVDYREKQHRRRVFMDFYRFHLENRGHAGGVYYIFPHLFKELQMNMEERLWYVFLCGCAQNALTAYVLYERFPSLKNLNMKQFSKFFRDNYKLFAWDIDRRYVKNKLEKCIESYRSNIGSKSQYDWFMQHCSSGNKYRNFRSLWHAIMDNFQYFGRLSTFSYTEYLRIAGLNIDCDSLFLDDINGSKSHRNGLCIVLGRDSLEWKKGQDVIYTPAIISDLTKEAEQLLQEARQKINHHDVSYFTLETTLCCFKGWHRVNRRYPNVYHDMVYDRIRLAEKNWPRFDFSIFWNSRQKFIPKHLRMEDNLLDRGLCKLKQNHYRLTGQVIMMEKEGYMVTNKPWLRNCILIIGECGTGKTWVMKSLLPSKPKHKKLGQFRFVETDDYIVVGKYDGTTFQGSDRLSMSVMQDVELFIKYAKSRKKLVICEGDRFTNGKFIEKIDPVIIRILGDGAAGRAKRGSKQSERHLKSIKTRVGNIRPHRNVSDSGVALELVKQLIEEQQ
jgi:hypothetical protein